MHQFNLTCSENTFRRAMHKNGMKRYIAARAPLKTNQQRQKRFQWATEHHHHKLDYWSKVLWTDECTFELDLRVKQRVTRERGQQFDTTKIQWQKRRKEPACINIWGAIGYNYKSPLVFIDGNGKNGAFLQADYTEQVLDAHMLSIMQDFKATCNNKPLLLEDGNVAHGLKSAHNAPAIWKKKYGVSLLAWAFNSADMNSIELIWHIMKQNLRKRRAEIKTLAQYRAAIEEKWDAVSLSKINALVAEMEKRVDIMYS